jgi:cob(I)alamin adenosyltransferase
MGNRLTKIYTRTGDDGSTGLGDGARVPKESLRVEAYGTVDEANSCIGVVLAVPTLPAAVRTCLTDVQHDLFDLGGELCIPGHRMVTAAYVDRLESTLDSCRPYCLPAGGTARLVAGPCRRSRA